ncbi:sn-glycerol-3-phosphate ABC transporter ATP-binding protein UgpC [Burkholderia vietnamiensis]|uniref:Sn-glycerol-3-phosphate ABC transporter ATP-binding protein UgpC n=1 Tax=Burkholderia vietnamiensis TaxID=60552 RepID=A0AAW7T2M0_BURVI|nr:sn-glycerol-3-phosphate ABC transporter ATP-binding protein UgpC [Burkholderia vietnamiensis]MBH9645795.1 sn-glycerol-3-phosphate ABC transporter ATP-binding protein UgpC [Burkholderia vietnamiensis]MBR8008931.1 sn-glycerol-3-phosphate ABC transporter ATP-binding protein UgpC [Burkholderia vietnamiensis]MDN7551249.1 sn-glycerol-3-phosphate ABC transporter ATP-binding protein UgpC [Burkholderia vietnamiensis]MDN7795063.1 sn-glycerol-3-phosphate ABC transporter ATP-binding protein UgpC [Burkho
MASISLRGVQKTYGDDVPVIRNVDLEIGEKEFCVFLGPSGCGKSTLLRMIAGLEDVTDGDLSIGSRLVNDVPAAQRGVAMVFQSYALFPHMTVYENMAFGLKLAKTPQDEVDRKVREAARILQLEALLERRPKALSGGQRQRVAIGRAIVREPGVFLFDEPLSNLDATLRGQTRVEIARLHKQFTKASVVYVTHDQIEAMTLADKIVLLHAGKDTERYGSVAQIGAPLDLYHRPASRFVAGFIGSPRMNFLAARVAAIDALGVTVTLDGGETVRASVEGGALQAGEAVTFGVRPEHLELAEGTQAVLADGLLARDVVLVEQLGEHTYVHLDDPRGAVLIAKVPGTAHLEPGERVFLRANAAACHLFTEDGFAVRPLESAVPIAHTV